jgi:Mg2+/citrate symporter
MAALFYVAPRVDREILPSSIIVGPSSFTIVVSRWGVGAMGNLGNTLYWFGCVVAATVVGIGLADYSFGDHHVTAFLSWAGLAIICWLVGRVSLLILARR